MASETRNKGINYPDPKKAFDPVEGIHTEVLNDLAINWQGKPLTLDRLITLFNSLKGNTKKAQIYYVDLLDMFTNKTELINQAYQQSLSTNN